MREKREVKYQMKVLSSLVKVFPDEEPVYRPECVKLSGLWDETVSYQVAYTGNHFLRERVDVKVISPIAEYVRVRTVEHAISSLIANTSLSVAVFILFSSSTSLL